MNPKTTLFKSIFGKKWSLPKAEKLSTAIRSFNLTEKALFYFFLAVFILSSLYLLLRVNSSYLVEVPVSGGTLEEGVIGYPRYINPVLAITDSGRDLTELVYSGLLKETSSGELAPDLAQSYSISPDGLTYDFVIKSNATFQDGAPVTADDIEFTVLKVQDPTLKSPKAASWEGVAVEKVNAREIKFILKKPYGPFLYNATLGILPKHLWNAASDADSFNLSNLNNNPIGSGPYMIKSIKNSSAGLPVYYHLVPFNGYAGGSAYIKDIIMRFYGNEEALLNAFNQNEIQSLNSISPDEISYVETRNTKIVTSPLPRVFGVFFNQSEDPVLIHQEVREALNTAVDRDMIVKEVLGGYGTAETEPIPGSLLPETSASGTSASSGSVEKAISILTSNGWKADADGIMEKSAGKGKSAEILKLTISTANAPDLIKTANILKDTWQKIGAEVDVKVFEANDLNQNVIRPRKYDALLFGEIIPPGLDVYGFWHSSERNDPGLNIALYTNSTADKLLEAARATSDEKTAMDDYAKFEKEVDNDVPAIFLYSPDFIYVAPKALSGQSLGNIITSDNRFIGIERWYLETEKVWKIFVKQN